VAPDIVKRLSEALSKATLAPDSREKFETIGLVPTGSTAAELAAAQANETAMWAEPVKASGYKGD
jgi:tripartite-type tricarboxylate transporter receptor subunit TctC